MAYGWSIWKLEIKGKLFHHREIIPGSKILNGHRKGLTYFLQRRLLN